MKRNPLILIIGLLLIILFGLLLFVFQLRETEVAVVTTFGKPTRPITQPGAHFKLPWPIQKVWKFDQRVQNFEDKLTQGLTSDRFAVLTSVYVGWRITEPTNFLLKFAGSGDPIARAEGLLEQPLSNAKIAVVGKHSLSDFLSASDNGTNFLAIENEILANVKSDVRAFNYGLEIEFLGLKKLELPESVTTSVFERMQKERQVLADRLRSEGDARAQIIRSEADTKALAVLAQAQGRATEIKGQGEAEAAKSLEVFQQNPGLANFLSSLNALRDSLKERSILVLDQHTPPFDLFWGVWGVSTNLFQRQPEQR